VYRNSACPINPIKMIEPKIKSSFMLLRLVEKQLTPIEHFKITLVFFYAHF
jgi:hypothetical protein